MRLPMQEMQGCSLGQEDPLEKKWPSTPVFLPGKSHGAEEPSGLQSMWLQRVGHDLATKQQHNAVSLILSHVYLYNMRLFNFFPFLLFLSVYI